MDLDRAVLPSVPVTFAMLCGDVSCGAVFDRRAHRRCPRCHFSMSLPITRYLDKINRPVAKTKEKSS